MIISQGPPQPQGHPACNTSNPPPWCEKADIPNSGYIAFGIVVVFVLVWLINIIAENKKQ